MHESQPSLLKLFRHMLQCEEQEMRLVGTRMEDLLQPSVAQRVPPEAPDSKFFTGARFITIGQQQHSIFITPKTR